MSADDDEFMSVLDVADGRHAVGDLFSKHRGKPPPEMVAVRQLCDQDVEHVLGDQDVAVEEDTDLAALLTMLKRSMMIMTQACPAQYQFTLGMKT